MASTRHIGLLAAAVFGLAGCGIASDWFPSREKQTDQPLVIEESEVSLYLRNMHTLATGTPDAQRRLFAEIQRRADRSPTTTSRLGLALAQATSGHGGTDIARGRATLESLLADPGLLVESERQLAGIVLNEIQLREQMAGASEAARRESIRGAAAESEQLRQSLAAERAQNARLAQALKEAEEKLSAITSIERSIRERSDDEPEL